METEFPLTAVINVMSHWGEIKKKQLGKEEKIKIKYYLAVKDALELGKGGVKRVTVSQCSAGVDGGHRNTGHGHFAAALETNQSQKARD